MQTPRNILKTNKNNPAYMKHLKALLVALLCAIDLCAEGKSLIITFSDNTKAEYALSTLPQISMADDKMKIETTATTAEFDLYKVKTFTFAATNGIAQARSNGFSISGDAIIVEGETAQIRIFAIDGKAVSVAPVRSAGQTIIGLGELPRGIYIINVNGRSVKITKR